MREDEFSAETRRLVAATNRLRAWREELTDEQAAAMQTMDTAFRAGELTAADVETIEPLIRKGQIHGARKRITAAKRGSPGAPDQPADA